MKIWARLDHPVFDSPMNHESGFGEDGILVAKRGRRCTMETRLLGSNQTKKKKTRDFERSARRYGNDDEEIRRLREYPEALEQYRRTLSALRRR